MPAPPVKEGEPIATKPGSRSPLFTETQGQYLAFIYAYTTINGRPPAEADFIRFFGVTPPTAHSMILTLHRRELIAREPRKPRSIELRVAPEDLPLLRPPALRQSIAISVSGY